MHAFALLSQRSGAEDLRIAGTRLSFGSSELQDFGWRNLIAVIFLESLLDSPSVFIESKKDSLTMRTNLRAMLVVVAVLGVISFFFLKNEYVREALIPLENALLRTDSNAHESSEPLFRPNVFAGLNGNAPEVIARIEADDPPRYTVQPLRDFPGQKRSEDEEKTFEEVCRLLMNIKPEPAARLAYFSWMKEPGCPIRFRSWGCMLRAAKPIPGGWAVTLQAMARAMDSTGHPYDVYDRFVEEYELTESGDIRFVRGYPHPDDGSGRPKYRRFSGL